MSEGAATLLASTAHHVRNKQPVVTFPTTGGGDRKVWWRFLALRGEPIFEIGNVCGTCEFWFRRLEPEAEPVDIDCLQQALTAGITGLDKDVVDAFERLLDSGTYRVVLLQFVPQLVEPGSTADYFTNEQKAGWPENGDEGPNDPGTPYYRVVGRSGIELLTTATWALSSSHPFKSVKCWMSSGLPISGISSH